MRLIRNARPRSASLIAAIIASTLPFPACDPATLTPQQRRLVTGTTDVGVLTLTATPTEATIVDTGTFGYTFTSTAVGNTAFSGTISLALAGLPPELALVGEILPNNFGVSGDTIVRGEFTLRAVGGRVDPADVLLIMTSVGEGGSRVVHTPVTIRVRASSRLRVSCQRTPDSGPVPLGVAFTAQPSNCEGPCQFSWDFGDGGVSDRRNPTWSYVDPGTYTATVVLHDDREGVATCSRTTQVFDASTPPPPPSPTPTPSATPIPTPTPTPSPTPSPTPTPTPSPNNPPSIQDLTPQVVPGFPLQRRIMALVFDPDPMDTLSWTLEVLSGTAPSTLTPNAGPGATLSSLFVASAAGTYTLRAHGLDNHGGEGTLTFTLTVP